MREQSEGYAKLTTDLIASLGPPHSSTTACPSESRKTVYARAAVAWDRVVSLIGYFDLDPNRALDIILDVFSVNIATHWQFFIALLACSPWVPEPAIMREWEDAESQMKVELPENVFRGKSLDDVLRIAESLARGDFGKDSDLPASGASVTKPKSKVLAQVLGFKFSYYQVGFSSSSLSLCVFSMAIPIFSPCYLDTVSRSEGGLPQGFIFDSSAANSGGVHNLGRPLSPCKHKIISMEFKANDVCSLVRLMKICQS